MDAELIRRQSALEDEHWWFRGRASIVRELLPPGGPGRQLLDIGCGWGGLTQHLVGWGHVRGVEPSAVAREEAARRGVAVLEGSAERLPVGDRSVDVALVSDVLEHLDDDGVALAEVRRVLRPGGVALITVPAYHWLYSSHDRALSHRRRYGRARLERAVRGAGLVPRRVTHYNTLLFPPIAAIRLLRRSRSRAPAEDARPTWPPLNAVLLRVFSFERVLLRRVELPFGLSLAMLVTRPAEPGDRGAEAGAR